MKQFVAYVTLDEAASMLRCSRKTVVRLVKSGRLQRYSRGGSRVAFFRREDVVAQFSRTKMK